MIDLRGGQASKKSHLIHYGYLRLLDSLEADIKHAEVNTLMSVVFQQAYAEQIIDKFVDQLPEPGALAALQSRWRSSVLNPILQRQLSGFSGDNPRRIEKHFSTLSLQEQELFYLQNDPLDCSPPALGRLMLGVMQVTNARWHLGLVNGIDYSKVRFQKCEEATNRLIAAMDNNQVGVWEKLQVEIVKTENLRCYHGLIYNEEVWFIYRPFKWLSSHHRKPQNEQGDIRFGDWVDITLLNEHP